MENNHSNQDLNSKPSEDTETIDVTENASSGKHEREPEQNSEGKEEVTPPASCGDLESAKGEDKLTKPESSLSEEGEKSEVTLAQSLNVIKEQITELSQQLRQLSEVKEELQKAIDDKLKVLDDQITRMNNQFTNRARGFLPHFLKKALHVIEEASIRNFSISPASIDAALQEIPLSLSECPTEPIGQKFYDISQKLSEYLERPPEELDASLAQLLVEFDMMLYDKSKEYIGLKAGVRKEKGKQLLEVLLNEYSEKIEVLEKSESVNGTILSELKNDVKIWGQAATK